MRLLLRATFGNPMMKFVAIKEIVCAKYDGCSCVILKLEKSHTVTRCKTACIQCAYARAYAAYATAEQPHNFDLMSNLIKRDSTALLAVKFVRAMWAHEKVVVVEGKDHPEPA